MWGKGNIVEAITEDHAIAVHDWRAGSEDMKEISNVREFTRDETARPIKELIQDRAVDDKDKILEYLKAFEPDCAAGMSLVDEVTGEIIDTGVNGYEDGQYYWDTRHIYHFEKYNLKLDNDFIAYVLNSPFFG